MTSRTLAVLAGAGALGLAACRPAPRQAAVAIDPAQLAHFAALPAEMASAVNPVTEAKVALGRALYFDTRLSRDGRLSCNSCHRLDAYGADTGATSVGFRGQHGGRNSPTVYNAAGHFVQFWDGRAPDVETQAKGPILNPVEMAMPDGDAVMRAIAGDSAYGRMFREAFPGEPRPMTYDNLGRAIGAFERRLVTPSRWDRFLAGDTAALTREERAGFVAFTSVGCAGCHNGAYVGGLMYQKAGLVRPWPDTTDHGRMDVTHESGDRMVFKVPSLRNVARTGPYFHNGRVHSLDTAVIMMGRYQLGRELGPDEVQPILAWLRALTGDLPAGVTPPPARTD